VNFNLSRTTIILNNTFEGNNIAYWSPLPNANRVVISNTGYSSSYGARLISLTNADGDAFMNQVISNLTPGSTYNLSAWLKSNLATNTNAFSVSINIRFNYPNGAYTVKSKNVFPNNVWTKYTNTFTVPTTANLQQCIVQIFTYRGQNNVAFVDNIELITPASNFGLMNDTVPKAPTEVFTENFKGVAGSQLSTTKWLVVRKAWGNTYVLNNNGVVPENLELLCNGGLRFHGHGDLYNGPIAGVGNALGNGKVRVGACIATKDYYASGRYEIVAKLTPGMVNAFWTFHYIDDPAYQSGGMKNSEVDFEFPSNNINGSKNVINDCLNNTWGGLCNGVGLTTSGISYNNSLNTTDASQAYHHFMIEWHTGGNGVSPSISWYMDSVLLKQETNSTYIPFRASRFWLGVWYGNSNWITGGNSSVMQYADKYMDVKSVKITPFYEANDIYENETNPATGFDGVTTSYPTFPCNSYLILKNVTNHNQNIQDDYADQLDISQYIIVSPIPATKELNVHITSNSTEDQFMVIELIDLYGRQIKKFTSTNPIDQDLNLDLGTDLAAGHYILKGNTKLGKIFTKKIVIAEK